MEIKGSGIWKETKETESVSFSILDYEGKEWKCPGIRVHMEKGIFSRKPPRRKGEKQEETGKPKKQIQKRDFTGNNSRNRNSTGKRDRNITLQLWILGNLRAEGIVGKAKKWTFSYTFDWTSSLFCKRIHSFFIRAMKPGKKNKKTRLWRNTKSKKTAPEQPRWKQRDILRTITLLFCWPFYWHKSSWFPANPGPPSISPQQADRNVNEINERPPDFFRRGQKGKPMVWEWHAGEKPHI